MNRKLVWIDISLFVIGVLLLTLTQLFTDYGALNVFTTALIAVILLTSIAVTFFFSFFRKDEIELSYANGVVAIALALSFFVVYTLPIYDFYGKAGVNNSVFFGIIGVLWARAVFYLHYKKHKKVSSALNEKFNPMKDFQNNVFYAGGFVLMLISVMIALANAVYPVAVASDFIPAGFYHMMGVV